MRIGIHLASIGLIVIGTGNPPQAQAPAPATPAPDAVRTLVSRLDLERYKATVKGLTQFGDRRQGTERNRKAVDWIEAQLKSYGCATERIKYDLRAAAAGPGQRPRPATPPAPNPNARAVGGGRPRGTRTRTGVNTDPMRQPDEKLRALNSEPATPGPREEVYCTKVGTTRPDEMYIVGAHMDGHGWGEAANDDGSGTALVMELARVFSMPDVQTERTIRFALWNNEETGLNGARAYVEQRKALQGKEDPPGSGRYPEPQLARDDPARHDDVRPRHAARRRHDEPEAAARGRRQHRVPVQLADGRRVAEAGLVPPRRQRRVRHRLPGAGRPAHDQHRLDAVHGRRGGDQPARERARRARRQRLGSALAPADRSLSPPSRTTTSGWA